MKLSPKKLVFLIATISLFMTPLTSQAADQYIQLSTSPDSCTVTVTNESGNGCGKSQCAGDASCACVSRNDHVHWILNSNDKFSIKFPDGSPLKQTCGKNFKKGKRKCVVKDGLDYGQSYNYEIYLQRCDRATDPRLVIK